MEAQSVKSMRRKQVIVMNGLTAFYLLLFFIAALLIHMTLPKLLFIVGVTTLIQASVDLVKGESTKRLIPIFEEVAIYEKQKMGKEWSKKRRTDSIWRIVIGGLMFLQYYLVQDAGGSALQIDALFIFAVAIITLIVGNISFCFHIKKIDEAASPSELKGYTWKTNIASTIIGLVLGFGLFLILLIWIISGI